MKTVVDFHSHILPGIDDGSRSPEESVAMLKMASGQGIRQMVATPHFYPGQDSPEQFLKRRCRAEARLREELAHQPGLPGITAAAEVYYYAGMSGSDILGEFTIGGGKHLLVEMPRGPWTKSMYRELEQLYEKQSIVPVIAHIDRYIRPFRTFGIPEQLEDLPVLVQANAEFFLNLSTRAMALRLLRADRIHLLGSDCHNMTDRAPNLGKAVSVIEHHGGEACIDRVNRYGAEVLGIGPRKEQ